MTRIERTDEFMRSLDLEAYRVGGSVRDEILRRKPKDADYIVRGAGLDRLRGLIQKNAPSAKVTKLKLRQGGQFGWRVALNGLGMFEVALPRLEQNAGNGRAMHVQIDPELPLAQDAKRRDFTFNALYKPVMDGDKGIADPTGAGLYDLARKIVRTTHPYSFRDDPLRTLRALRFVSVLGYDLSVDTQAQMRTNSAAVDGLTEHGYASGTLLDELQKILMGDHVAKALRLMRDTGVMTAALPELDPMIGFEQKSRYHDMSVDEHTFVALETAAKVGAPLRVRMALLFHDSGKPESAWMGEDGRLHYYHHDGAPTFGCTQDHEVAGAARWDAAAKRMNATRELRNDVNTLVLNHMVSVQKPKGNKVRQMRVKFGDAMLRDLLLHRACDICGKGAANKSQLTNIGRMVELLGEARDAGVPASVKDLSITGQDVAELGADGRQIGEILRRVLHEVVSQPDERTLSREWQLERAKALT